MYFKFDCPHCGKSLKVKEENSGQRARCPYCRNSMTVPEPPVEEDGPDDALGALSSAASGDEEAPARSSPPSASDDIPIARPRRKPAPSASGDDKAAAGQSRKAAPPAESSSDETDGTNVSLARSGVLGLVVAIAYYVVVVAPLTFMGGEGPDASATAKLCAYLAGLFLKSGWIAPFLTFLMGWSLSILWLKHRKLRRQKESMLFDVLPNEISEQITVDKVDEFTDHIRSLPVKPTESFLINRVLRGLEHFRVLRNNSEVASRLAVQSDIDAAAVESSYTIIKVFIWAIPILGFIGTVLGISAAVGAFAGNMDSAQDVSALKDSLNNVTSGLALAFDTTLLALIMSIIAMLPTSLIQKSEEDLINWVDEYTNENLLKRLNDGDIRDGADTGAIDRAVEAAMAKHHIELQSWTEKLEKIGEKLSDHVVKGWDQVNDRAVASMSGKHQALLQQMQALEDKMASLQDEQVDKMQAVSEAVESTAKVNERRASDYQKIFEQDMDQLAEKLEQVIDRVAERSSDSEQQMADSLTKSAESIREYMEGLGSGIESLNRVLEQLGEKQVVIKVEHPEPARRGWFFGRRNGA